MYNQEKNKSTSDTYIVFFCKIIISFNILNYDRWITAGDYMVYLVNDHEKTLRNVKLVNYASQVFTTFSWQLHAYVYPSTWVGHLLRRMH